MLDIIDPVLIGAVIAVVIFFGILAFLMIGRRIGRRDMARYGAAGLPSIGSLEAAVFALLGLMIAFTFSGALSRFDARRGQVVDEANAMAPRTCASRCFPRPRNPRCARRSAATSTRGSPPIASCRT